MAGAILAMAAGPKAPKGTSIFNPSNTVSAVLQKIVRSVGSGSSLVVGTSGGANFYSCYSECRGRPLASSFASVSLFPELTAAGGGNAGTMGYVGGAVDLKQSSTRAIMVLSLYPGKLFL